MKVFLGERPEGEVNYIVIELLHQWKCKVYATPDDSQMERELLVDADSHSPQRALQDALDKLEQVGAPTAARP